MPLLRYRLIREQKQYSTLADFMADRFKPWVEATFREKPRTAVWYCGGIQRISEFSPLAKALLNDITADAVHAYIAKRQADGLNVTSINRELQILRRILNLAVEWGAVQTAPKIKLRPGETRRERVITQEEEALYLAATPEPLYSVATVLADSGMRPDEGFGCGGTLSRGRTPVTGRCSLPKARRLPLGESFR